MTRWRLLGCRLSAKASISLLERYRYIYICVCVKLFRHRSVLCMITGAATIYLVLSTAASVQCPRFQQNTICLMHGGDDDPNSATSTAAVNFHLYLGRGGRERETSDTWRQTRPRCTSSGRTRYSLRDVELGRARGTESEKNVDKIEYKGKHPWCEYVPGIILKIGHFTLHLLKINR